MAGCVPVRRPLWFSEAGDVWDDYQHSLGAGNAACTLPFGISNRRLDCVLDGDDLKPYKVLYLTDRHVSRAGSQALAAWVKAGGRCSPPPGPACTTR